MQLSPHFVLGEFEQDAPVPVECLPIYTRLCNALLEPIRAQFNTPMMIMSGYRTVESNAAAHGVSNSQHVATEDYCAADFNFAGAISMMIAFDWIREQPSFMWDQLILEHGATSDIIHISVCRENNRRMALEGDTANRSAYTPHDVVPYAAQG